MEELRAQIIELINNIQDAWILGKILNIIEVFS